MPGKVRCQDCAWWQGLLMTCHCEASAYHANVRAPGDGCREGERHRYSPKRRDAHREALLRRDGDERLRYLVAAFAKVEKGPPPPRLYQAKVQELVDAIESIVSPYTE